jgi:ElaB/YqjD/DUF883 family membrane-anchored ribosome-binding protein
MHKQLPPSEFDDLKDLISTVSSETSEIVKIKCLIIKNKVAQYAAKNPYQTLGIAALAGLFLGLRHKK